MDPPPTMVPYSPLPHVLEPRAYATPAADIIEFYSYYKIVLDMPGVLPGSFKFQIENPDDGSNSVLVITAERTRQGDDYDTDEERGPGTYLKMERPMGMMRKFVMPNRVHDPDDPDASVSRAVYKDGVLTVSFINWKGEDPVTVTDLTHFTFIKD